MALHIEHARCGRRFIWTDPRTRMTYIKDMVVLEYTEIHNKVFPEDRVCPEAAHTIIIRGPFHGRPKGPFPEGIVVKL